MHACAIVHVFENTCVHANVRVCAGVHACVHMYECACVHASLFLSVCECVRFDNIMLIILGKSVSEVKHCISSFICLFYLFIRHIHTIDKIYRPK